MRTPTKDRCRLPPPPEGQAIGRRGPWASRCSRRPGALPPCSGWPRGWRARLQARGPPWPPRGSAGGGRGRPGGSPPPRRGRLRPRRRPAGWRHGTQPRSRPRSPRHPSPTGRTRRAPPQSDPQLTSAPARQGPRPPPWRRAAAARAPWPPRRPRPRSGRWSSSNSRPPAGQREPMTRSGPAARAGAPC